MLLSRRELFCYGTSLTLLSMMPFNLLARKKKNWWVNKPSLIKKSPNRPLITKKLSLYNIHTGEFLKTTYMVNGRLVADEINVTNRFFRDHRYNEIKAMDIRLLNLLFSLQNLLGYKKAFDVISGYRSPKTNQKLLKMGRKVAKNSYHMRGMAVDINMRGIPLRHAQRAACSLACGGVGYYPSSHFIHLDTRGHFIQWSGV